MNDITVIKIGGSTFGSRDTTIEDIVTLQMRGEKLVVVHGGGQTVTDWLERLGIETKFVRGERVTDAATLDVATAVLAGLANKEITAAINVRGGRAVGISGVDGHLIEARAKSAEMGYVGEVTKVNPAVLEALVGAGFVPVVASISLYTADRPADAAEIINVNGDPAAGDLAAALRAKKLVFLTDVDGVRDKVGNPLRHLTQAQAEASINDGTIAGGMIPKINAGLIALKAGTLARIIDGRQPHALVRELEGGDGGTTIAKGEG
jgi:acetylglutamate kinase